jgi:lipopolysaccharide/colanic/teichoic acid biosynthesis glycosyltransferase
MNELTQLELPEQEILCQKEFQKALCLERKRSERSRKPFLLMLLSAGGAAANGKNARILHNVVPKLRSCTRETDMIGWHEEHAVLGVMFTEIGSENGHSLLGTMLTRTSEALSRSLSAEHLTQIQVSYLMFPQDWDEPQQPGNDTLFPDVHRDGKKKLTWRLLKRSMDVVGSLFGLVLCAPLFAILALAIRITSSGPVFYRHQRIGQFGVPFQFLKFRSMYIDADSTAHEQYVKELINGTAVALPDNGNGKAFYKLTNDTRVTPLGRFLRRTSLDELPQLINVLKGEMSLVGPRPALGYEVANYDLWHRRRLLVAKPGITGLWQVNGRSRVKFDDMVRMDLEYARTWSPWLDLKILWRTPRAVVAGIGAY